MSDVMRDDFEADFADMHNLSLAFVRFQRIKDTYAMPRMARDWRLWQRATDKVIDRMATKLISDVAKAGAK